MEQTNKPTIIVKFENDLCTWHSDGWGNNEQLMKTAREAIRKGNTPEEVTSELANTFEVVTRRN